MQLSIAKLDAKPSFDRFRLMRHDQYGLPQPATPVHQGLPYLSPQRLIDCGQWFVEQQQFRFCTDGAGDAEPLLLSTRQFIGSGACQVCQLQALQNLSLELRITRPGAGKRKVLVYVEMTP